MKLNTGDHVEDYESEALSILSRFNESGIHLEDLNDLQEHQLSIAIVRHAFTFWFGDMTTADVEPAATELLSTFKEAYAQKSKEKKEVKSVVIG
jgi:hypothetical protein